MLKKMVRIAGRIFFWFLSMSVALVLLYRFLPPPGTFLMVQRLVVQSFEDKPLRLSKDWEPSENISLHLKKAVIAAEDQNFLTHNGFDLEAIEKAYEGNKKGKRIRGASTISQQVAKNVFLWPGRSWLRKGFEVYFTVLIELFWDKERILEMYLNVAELGEGIYGAEAASKAYFNKSASKISKEQAALLAAVLPNPRRWSVVKPGAYVKKRQRWILVNMNRIGPVDL